jgi:sporulation protein YlmC with PRC-barrel domain
MDGNIFDDTRILEGTRVPGSNPVSLPDRESSAISRDDVRDGFAEPGTGTASGYTEKIGDVRTPLSVIAAGTLAGYRVRNTAGEDLGVVAEIMIDVPSGRIAYAVFSFGGFLGIGDKRFAVPWRALQIDESAGEFVLDADRSVLDLAPGLDKDGLPDMSDRTFGAWEHNVTDAGDYSGDNRQPNRSMEFEQTSSYRAGNK